jgi:CotH kinase protein/Chitobiase/beta-hexosaminidase C-terminal domain/Fn3 associated
MAIPLLICVWRFSRKMVGVVTFLSAAARLAAADGAKADLLPAPSFSVPGGVFTNDVTLALSSQTAAATIRYTLDGSEATAASAVYATPITLTNSTVVRARVFASGQPAGKPAVQSYVLLEPEVIDFNSNLPLVLLNTFAQEIKKDEKTTASARFIDTQRGRSSILAAADFDGRALINLRGRASLRYPKRSYTFKTVDASEDMAAFSILGLPKESDWVLYAPYPDKTLMRDVLAYELSNEIGRWAPRTRFVELFLNETGGKVGRRDYLGVYVFEEKVKRDKNRVNIANLGPDDNATPKLTGGFIFKKDHNENDGGGPMWGPGPAFQAASSSSKNGFPTGPGAFPGDPEGFQPSYRGTSRSTSSSSSSSRSSRNSNLIVTNYLGAPTRRALPTASRTIMRSDDDEEIELFEDESLKAYFRTNVRTNKFYYVDPEPDELTGVQRAWLQNYVNQCEAVLYGMDFKDATKGYAAFLDADSFIDYHLLVEVTKNVDGFRFSTFFHKDRGGKIRMGPVWDWNLSFGNCNGKQGYLPEWWLWPQLDDKEYSWFRRLFEDPDFGQKYVDRWTELRATAFAVSNLLGRVDAIAAVLQEAQARNFERWPILGSAINPNWFAGDTYADEVKWMREWIEKRLAWIDKQFVQPPSVTQDGEKLALTALRGKTYYTLDGTDPRGSGGTVSGQALAYDSPIAIPAGKTLFARALHNNRWSGPLRFPQKP